MPLAFGPNFVEGKVYRSKKKQDGDEEKQALRELQTLLALKNRRSCGCEAQVHDLLENCLNCGRLTCVSEGAGKCFSCGNLILTQDQRERLHQYIDISCHVPAKNNDTSRGKIIDDQFDHFAIDNKRHLREDDRRRLKNNLDQLQAQRYQTKLVLEVDIDDLQAGSRSTAKIDNYEAELRRLQIDNESNDQHSGYTLAELVEQEYRNNSPLQYIGPDLNIKKKTNDSPPKSEKPKKPQQKQQQQQKHQQQQQQQQQQHDPKLKSQQLVKKSQPKRDKAKPSSAWTNKSNKSP